jgi:hypothetical protein
MSVDPIKHDDLKDDDEIKYEGFWDSDSEYAPSEEGESAGYELSCLGCDCHA